VYLELTPQFREKGSWFVLHDNVPVCSAMTLKLFLAILSMVDISQPHIHLTSRQPTFSFPKVKIALRDKTTMLSNKTLPHAFSSAVFDGCFVQL
jgi:hypothetical protein